MPSKKPQIKTLVTPDQKAAIDKAIEKSGMRPQEAGRFAWMLFCQHFDDETTFEGDDMPPQGNPNLQPKKENES